MKIPCKAIGVRLEVLQRVDALEGVLDFLARGMRDYGIISAR